MLVPTKVSFTYELIGKGKHGEAAIRALRADNYRAAFSEFEHAHQEDPKRDMHVFGMGVTAELMGDPQRALELYREAASMPGVDKEDMPIYLAAKQRLTTRLPRITRAAPPPREPERGG
jgi:tetratricopeptide (TPR) repeat protein